MFTAPGRAASAAAAGRVSTSPPVRMDRGSRRARLWARAGSESRGGRLFVLAHGTYVGWRASTLVRDASLGLAVGARGWSTLELRCACALLSGVAAATPIAHATSIAAAAAVSLSRLPSATRGGLLFISLCSDTFRFLFRHTVARATGWRRRGQHGASFLLVVGGGAWMKWQQGEPQHDRVRLRCLVMRWC